MVSKQITIRPQDVVVLLKIVCFNKRGAFPLLKKDLASELSISNAEITNVFERLRWTGLIDGSVVQLQALYEFLVYGLKHTFPAIVGPEAKGVLTSTNAISEAGINAPNYVWPDYQGSHRGHSISPLYPEVIAAVKKDESLYSFLAVCDMLRIGQTREINFAREWLKRNLLS